MTPPMYERVKNLFVAAGLTTNFTIQALLWVDTKESASNTIVFRPNGGTAIRSDLGSEHYVLVDVIGGKGKNSATDIHVEKILDHIQSHPMSDECVGYIQNIGGKPSPILSEEGRLIYRLQFGCTYGE